MVALTSRLRCRDDDVVAKVMDGEAVIINLGTGVYYSLDRVGAVIWELIERGHRLDDIAAAVAAGYGVPSAVAQTDTLRLAAELLSEDLVVESPQAPDTLSPIGPAPAAQQPYVAPTLNAYTDMEDLLALDPPTPAFADIPLKE